MGRHELECFIRASGLEEAQMRVHDLLDGPPTLAAMRAHDAVMMGGSGDFYVSKGNLPDFAGVLEVLGELVDSGHPTFASCFGYQLLVKALGGVVVYDPERTEVGTFELRLTDPGRRDDLMGGLPDAFLAQLGHKDRAVQHPPGLANLATSELSPLQAFRIPRKPIWAVQFHPELDREANLHRFEAYMEGYAGVLSDVEREKAYAGFRESPEADLLIRRFLELVFG